MKIKNIKKGSKKLFGKIVLATLIISNSFSYASSVITNFNEARSISSDIVRRVENLKKQHPNWKFEFVNTGYSFEDMAKMQFGEGRGLVNGYSPINLIESYGGTRYNEAWLDPARRHLAFDANRDKLRWQAPSIEAVRYFLDPRTYINENDIFLFLSLQGNNDKFDEAKTKEMIRSVLAGTKNESRVNEVYNAAKAVDIDVLEIATKLRQEGGLEPNRGYNYYNPLNVGATGSDPELEGLQYAQSKGWDTFEKGLIGCALVVKNNYIGRGQDTKYFMKFNVANGSIYHQYMQNITAPLTEGKSLKSAYQKYDNNLSGSYTFKIPLFNDMSKTASPRPQLAGSKNNAIIITDLLYLRSLPSSKNGERLKALSNGKEFEVIEEVKSGTDGIYSWYKINVDNTIGYAARYKLSNPSNIYFDIYNSEDNTSDNNSDDNNQKEEKTELKPEEYTPEDIKYLNNKENFENKVKIKNDYIYLGYNLDLEELVRSHIAMEVYENSGGINDFSKSEEKRVNTNNIFDSIVDNTQYNKEELQKMFKTGNIIVLNSYIYENGEYKSFTKPLKVIRKGDLNKDGKVSLDDLMLAIDTINEDITLDELQKVASFVQLGYTKEVVNNLEVSVLNASNITYAIFDNISKKYTN